MKWRRKIPDRTPPPAGSEPDPALEVEQAAIGFLAQREHSRLELERKLARRFAQDGLVAVVLDDLQRRGLVSDQRFAESYVAMRMRKGFGPLRIRAELKERGIEGALVDACLDTGRETWMGQLREAASHRFGTEAPSGRAEQGKQARFLQYRGFPESLIRDYLWD